MDDVCAAAASSYHQTMTMRACVDSDSEPAADTGLCGTRCSCFPGSNATVAHCVVSFALTCVIVNWLLLLHIPSAPAVNCGFAGGTHTVLHLCTPGVSCTCAAALFFASHCMLVSVCSRHCSLLRSPFTSTGLHSCVLSWHCRLPCFNCVHCQRPVSLLLAPQLGEAPSE